MKGSDEALSAEWSAIWDQRENGKLFDYLGV